jgi:hypothetical protein
VARKGSLAKIGVVFLAPVALGMAIVGFRVALSNVSLLGEHGPTDEHGPTHGGWVLTCFVAAGLLFVWWVACIVRVWTTRARDDEPIPQAKTIERR